MQSKTKKRILVWDLPTRLFHWSLAVAVFYSWFSVDVLEDMQQHFYSGYAVLTLLLFRLIWGFIGSDYSRFTSFLHSRSDMLSYAKGFFTSDKKPYIGHNPLGSLSAILMIILLLVQAILGLFSSDDYYFGPLSGLISSDLIGRLSELHSLNSNAVFSLIALHIAAIIYYKFGKNEVLTLAMVTGRKKVSENQGNADSSQQGPTKSLLALVALVLCIALVYWLATAFLDRLPTPTESYY